MSSATMASPPIPPAPRGQRPAIYSPEDRLILPAFHCRVCDLLPPVSMSDTDTVQSAAEADRTAAPAE